MCTHWSCRRPSRPVTRTAPRRQVLVPGGAQQSGQGLDHRVIRSGLPPLDSLQFCGRYPSGRCQLRLGQPAQDAPVTWIPFVAGDGHDVLYRVTKQFHHRSQFVHLRREGACLPGVNGRRRHSREAREIAHRHRRFSQCLESFFVESAQNAAAHTMTSKLTILNHRAHLSQYGKSVGIDSEYIPDYSNFRWAIDGLKGRSGA